MKPLYTLLLVGSILSASCNQHTHSVVLTESSIYAIDSVRMAIPDGDEKAAERKLQEASSMYKKSSDTSKSIQLFKNSVMLDPTAKAYFELAGALLATRQFDEGVKSLAVAEALGYNPLANVMFRYAYAYANMHNGQDSTPQVALVNHYMELAIQMGYAHPRQFLQKDLFPNEARNFQYEKLLTNAIGGGAVKDPGKSLWDAFEGQFPEVSLPLVIDRSWMRSHKRDAYIDYQYEKFIPEMRTARFSREGGDTYYYVALIRREANYVALLYCDASEMDDDTQVGEPLFTLVTYDRQGRIIDRMPVAGRKDLSSPFLVFSIKPNLQFQVQEYRQVYKSSPDSAGYDTSNITREDPQPPTDFRIVATGKFERTSGPLALQ